MGYQPTIVIKLNDLKKVVPILEQERWVTDGDVQEVAIYLLDVANSGILAFDGLELVLCRPTSTHFNYMVRKRLSELDVKFEVDN